MKTKNHKGFSKKEGYVVFSALIGVVVMGTYGLIDQPIMLLLFICCFITFMGIYSQKLCKSCDKLCPFNPNMKFWTNNKKK